MNLIYTEIMASASEVCLLFFGLAMLVIGVFCKKHTNRKIEFLFILSMFASFVALQCITGYESYSAFNNFVVTNSYILFAKTLVIISSLIIFMLYSSNKSNLVNSRVNKFEFPIVMLFAVLGVNVMISANDFLTFYLGLELQSLSMYILASFERDDKKSSEAGLKYFIMGALSSGLILYSISLFYGFSGTTNFDSFSDLYSNGSSIENTPIILLVAISMFILGFCFKLSAAPFHMWSPDLYQGAPLSSASFIATVPKIGAMVIFTRILLIYFESFTNQWQQIVCLVSVLSMFVGALGAIQQQSLRRLIAYSSIGHMGFMLMGVASANYEGLSSILIYLVIYLTMIIASFALIMMMQKKSPDYDNISNLAGLAKYDIKKSLVISILMFSMAGIPPFAGFYAKLYVFKAAIEANLMFLAILGLVASVISAFYYIRIIKIMFFDEPVSKTLGDMRECNCRFKIILYVLGAFNALFFLFSVYLVNYIYFVIAT